MALPSLQPRRLGRYRDLALLLFKYGRSDLLSRAGLEEILAEDLPATDPGTAAPEELAHDLPRRANPIDVGALSCPDRRVGSTTQS